MSKQIQRIDIDDPLDAFDGFEVLDDAADGGAERFAGRAAGQHMIAEEAAELGDGAGGGAEDAVLDVGGFDRGAELVAGGFGELLGQRARFRRGR